MLLLYFLSNIILLQLYKKDKPQVKNGCATYAMCLAIQMYQEISEQTMKCNLQLAELQVRLDEAKSHTVSCDYQYSDANNSMRQRTLTAGHLIMLVHTFSHRKQCSFSLQIGCIRDVTRA